ncbi:MAG: hypothetical protein ABI230_12910 [Aestuariivirga sp.]
MKRSFVTFLVSYLSLICVADAKELPVASFGNWYLSLIDENHSIKLRGVGTVGKDPSSFTIQCYAESPDAISISVNLLSFIDEPPLPAQLSVESWSTGKSTTTTTFLKLPTLAAVMLSAHSPEMKIDTQKFIASLRNSQGVFKYSLQGKTFEYDVSDLTPAYLKFQELCKF